MGEYAASTALFPCFNPLRGLFRIRPREIRKIVLDNKVSILFEVYFEFDIEVKSHKGRFISFQSSSRSISNSTRYAAASTALFPCFNPLRGLFRIRRCHTPPCIITIKFQSSSRSISNSTSSSTRALRASISFQSSSRSISNSTLYLRVVLHFA